MHMRKRMNLFNGLNSWDWVGRFSKILIPKVQKCPGSPNYTIAIVPNCRSDWLSLHQEAAAAAFLWTPAGAAGRGGGSVQKPPADPTPPPPTITDSPHPPNLSPRLPRKESRQRERERERERVDPVIGPDRGLVYVRFFLLNNFPTFTQEIKGKVLSLSLSLSLSSLSLLSLSLSSLYLAVSPLFCLTLSFLFSLLFVSHLLLKSKKFILEWLS